MFIFDFYAKDLLSPSDLKRLNGDLGLHVNTKGKNVVDQYTRLRVFNSNNNYLYLFYEFYNFFKFLIFNL